MRFVACSGFPIPVSRYFREFKAVEISDSELGLPGEGTVRRWKREAPEGYGFSVIAPKVLAESGWKKSPEQKEIFTGLAALGVELGAKAVVFNAPEDFKFNKVNKATMQAFVKSIPAKFPAIVLDLPAWQTNQISGIDDRIVPAFDPLKDDVPAGLDFAYVRLMGPAGHRSRYDEPSIERILEQLNLLKAKSIFCVFRNIDMHANASQIQKKWK
jgi:uncharacterized protein YecE (DUF72 family)